MIDEQNIKEQYREHEAAFNKITSELLESLHKIASAFYQNTRFRVVVLPSRIKSVDSVIKKMRRKGIYTDSLFKQENGELSLVVNDFIGARISCNTREDVEEIKKLIIAHRRVRLLKEELLKKPSGYRALHLDIHYQAYWDDEIIFIPVEIQIKTHLQNAWGDITHDESYKPENEELKNEWERQYSKHMADMLDVLDDMASTIRAQRLSFVRPPQTIEDADTIINEKTLSYKVDQLIRGERVTKQEMSLAINRLKEEGFETVAEVSELLEDNLIKKQIKSFKEKLRNNEPVKPFEILYYGSLLKRNNIVQFEEEMTNDYGFVQWQCISCNRLLTLEEYDYLRTETDADEEYYCTDHRAEYFEYECSNCGKLTAQELCKDCEANNSPF